MTGRIRVRSTALVLLLLLTPAAGCRRSNPAAPGPSGSVLQTIWPNEDGRSWTYRSDRRFWSDTGGRVYSSADSVPPAPSLSEIAAILGTQPIGSLSGSDSATYRLEFAGMITTQSGVTKQNLRETLIRPSPPATSSRARSGEAAFLARLWRARPDLRPRITARVPAAGMLADTSHWYASIFLHGYAWEKTAQWIGTYGDVDTLLAWKYLSSSLWPGSEFAHQLVPSLASDVWLHARILGTRSVQTPAGTFPNALLCLYLVDYGISELTDPAGNPAGFSRSYGYGAVWYVDGVGPVACYERMMLMVGGGSVGLGDITIGLTSFSPALSAWRAW